MAFGHNLNAMERLARWDVLLGAQPKEDVEDTHSHIHVDSVCHGILQQYYRINYWLDAGGVMLHRVSREPGRSMRTAEGFNIPSTHTVHAGSRPHVPTSQYTIGCYLFCNKPSAHCR